MSPIPTLRQTLSQSFRPHTFRLRAAQISSTRQFTHTSLSRYPRKGFEDRNSINAEATEYTKSGTDNTAAEQDEAAFDPKKTDPQQEKETAGKGTEDSQANPLEVSPANPQVSKPRGETEGGAQNAGQGERERTSGAGSPQKAGKAVMG